MPETDAPPEAARQLRGALRRYRVMAIVVGTLLLVLVCVAIPLQYAAGKPAMAGVVAPLHGACYVVYLVTVADLARRARFRLRDLAVMVGAGFVPGLAFFVERRITARFQVAEP